MEVNRNKVDRIKELGRINISSLKQKIMALEKESWDTQEDFNANYNKDGKALHQTQHIIFKFSNKQTTPFEYYNCSRWNDWKHELLPIMNQVTQQYGYTNGFYPRVMLAKLPPKSFIGAHTDGDANGSIPHKIHIPIASNINTFFYINDTKYNFKEGVAYEVNNSVKHAVANNGDTARIHLIFEYLNIDDQIPAIKENIKLSMNQENVGMSNHNY